MKATFTITYDEETGEPDSITCLRCNKTSYNQNDIEFEYCANCRQFHEILSAFQEE